MQQTQLFHVKQTAAAGGHLGFNARADTGLLAPGGTEGAHHVHVGNHIDKFTIDRRGLPGIRAVDRGAMRCQAENHRGHGNRHRGEAAGH